MAILGNYEDNYDTETTTANKSMGFDLQSILLFHSISLDRSFAATPLHLMPKICTIKRFGYDTEVFYGFPKDV